MKIPTPTELHPRLSELESKRNALHAEKTAKVAEAAVIRARIQESPSTGNVAENRVRQILGEPSLPDSAPDMARLEQLLLELNDLNKAIGILDGAIQAEKTRASRMVCEAVRPEVTKLGTAFAKAFLALHTAQHAYHDYLDQIQDTGASVSSLPHVFISGLGSSRDRSGTFMYGTKDFIEAGYLTPSDMPKVLT
jgi:hypothetical protein